MAGSVSRKLGTVTITSGGTNSTDIVANTMLLASITLPSSLAGAASFTIQKRDDINLTYTTVTAVSGGSDYIITLTASKTIPLDKNVVTGLGVFRLVANTAAAADLVIGINGVEAQ
jgi:hypothetical protein